MKAVLPEWYGPNDDQIKSFVTEATIALDANILLAPYRVGDKQRTDLFKVLRQVSERLWVPYQSALEYQRNRLSVASQQQQLYDSIAKIGTERFDEALEGTIAKLEELRSQAIKGLRDNDISGVIANGFSETLEEIKKVGKLRKEKMRQDFDELRQKHAIDFTIVRKDDPIRAELDSIILPGNIGKRLDGPTRSDRVKKAQERVSNGIPPGYKDAGKEDPTGDCLIWFELLDLAKESSRPVLFVTDDEKKEDWYERVHGQTIGPRVELRAEMLEFAGQPYHQTTLDRFLQLANVHLKSAVPEETISQYRTTRSESKTERLLREALSATGVDQSSDGGPAQLSDIEMLLEQELAVLQAERRKARVARRNKVALLTDSDRHRVARENARALTNQGMHAEAISLLENLLESELVKGAYTDLEPMRTQIALAHAFRGAGDVDSGINVLNRLYVKQKVKFGEEDPRCESTARLINDMLSSIADMDMS
ncbi:PIN-like domain-containing protein [Nocardia sp. CDC186]|uniref:PIN-like domain-containing protein n=1 Tax=Nocardia implantans TaxID=3108168 RepID=A0ABU6AZE3_9NOCA|nr:MULTISPECIES: PIN-like domain-containing protein [unclassified Nocardia]MBF6194158.1 hypothetical protein [Nocardia beijingensis]MEA3529766.1 PIN-like domain-containing protein [Nocardia sp. CDC192]MEB3512756.1 PIN-like domain-containing protein [Nocardia sp. CDC186]